MQFIPDEKEPNTKDIEVGDYFTNGLGEVYTVVEVTSDHFDIRLTSSPFIILYKKGVLRYQHGELPKLKYFKSTENEALGKGDN